MRVILPWAAGLRGRPVEALRVTGWHCEARYVGDSDRAYFDLLCQLWAAGETFCIVEHDIVVHPSALDELAECAGDWCGFPHHYAGELVYGLGCVKFDAALMRRHPDAMIRAGVLADMQYPARHWYRLDPALQMHILPHRGEEKCRHHTVVEHLGTGTPPPIPA